MWFAAMSQPSDYEWFAPLLVKLLRGRRGDARTAARRTRFPDRPPRYVRAQYYRTGSRRPPSAGRTGRWWTRELIGIYYPAVSLGEA